MGKCETCENEAGMFVQCDDCRYDLAEIDGLTAYKRIGSLMEQNKALDASIAELKQECQALSDENVARWKVEASLSKLLHDVAYVLAMDTIIDRTHRERNEMERRLVKRIMQLFDADVAKDMDDIPF